MSSQPNGFDPNQKRDGRGRFSESHGSRPASGALAKPPAEWPDDAWPDDAWPDDSTLCATCSVNDVVPGDGKCQDCLDRETAAMPDPSRECRECGRPVTIPGNTCQACLDLHAQIAADYPDEDEEAQMQAAADRAKQLEAEADAHETPTTVRVSFEDQYARAEQEHREHFEQAQECAHCDEPHHANGLCKRHYDEKRRYEEEREYGTTNIREGSRTPWGSADYVTEVAPGIASISTEGHGGYKLTPTRNKKIPAPFRQSSGWYEEDTEWAAVGATFPEELCRDRPQVTPERMREMADASLREWSPDAYETWTGRALQPGESHTRDEKAWGDAHAHEFVGDSGSKLAETDPGMRVVSARRATDGTSAEYLVPVDEYEAGIQQRPGEFGRRRRFVVDPSRHARLPDAPPPAAPAAKVDAHLSDDDLVRLRGSAKGRNQERIEKDLRQRWRSRDGQVRTLEDLLKTEGVYQKTAFITDSGGSQYALVQADGSSMRVSKSTWEGLTTVPDMRQQSQKLNDRIHQAYAKIDKVRSVGAYSVDEMRAQRVKVRALNAEIEALSEMRDDASKRERAAYDAEHGTWEERQQRDRDAQAERERQARVDGPA